MEAMEQENNPFESINATFTEEHRIPIAEYLFVIGQFVHFVTSLVGLSAQIFLVVVICRYKRLKTRTNLLIVNMMAAGSVYFLTTILFFAVDLFWFWNVVAFVNVVLQLQSTTLMLYVVFSVLLAVDWSLGCYKRELAEKLRRHDRSLYSVVYLVSLLEFVVAVVYVELRGYVLRLLVANFVYLACVAVTIALNVLRGKMADRIDATSRKTMYSFDLCNIVIFFMLPCLLWNIPYFFVGDVDVLEAILVLNVVPSMFWMGHPVYAVYKLGEWDKNFKMAYGKAMRRSSVRDYDDDGLDAEEAEEDERGLVRDAGRGHGGQFETVI